MALPTATGTSTTCWTQIINYHVLCGAPHHEIPPFSPHLPRSNSPLHAKRPTRLALPPTVTAGGTGGRLRGLVERPHNTPPGYQASLGDHKQKEMSHPRMLDTKSRTDGPGNLCQAARPALKRVAEAPTPGLSLSLCAPAASSRSTGRHLQLAPCSSSTQGPHMVIRLGSDRFSLVTHQPGWLSTTHGATYLLRAA